MVTIYNNKKKQTLIQVGEETSTFLAAISRCTNFLDSK